MKTDTVSMWEFLSARASVCTAPLVLIRWNGGTKRVDDYLDALCKELTFIREQMRSKKADIRYISGGGTPTTLEPEQLRQTACPAFRRTFDFTWVKELYSGGRTTGQYYAERNCR